MKGKKGQLSLWPLHGIRHPLDGPRLKVGRAEGKLKRLRRIEQSLRRCSKYQAVRAEMDPKSGEYVYRVKSDSPDLPLELGADVGEIAHGLRSALDHLVTQLVLFAGNTTTRRAQFPICLTGRGAVRQPSFLSARADRLQGVLPEHQAIIEGLQPYKRGRGGKSDPLWTLQQIDNSDKHKLIAGVIVGITGIDVAYKGRIALRKFLVLKDGAKIFRASRYVYVYPNLAPLILFGDEAR